MLIYEVNLEVEEEIKFRFAGWLPDHITKMLETEGFRAAYWFFRNPEDEGLPESMALWTIQYIVSDRAVLDKYLTGKAAQMRQEAIDLFGVKFKATRRILQLLSVAGLPFDGGEPGG